MSHRLVAAAPLALLLASSALAAGKPNASNAPRVEKVASFDHQVTGVTVSETGRIFVNFPRWSEDAPVSVAEVIDGKAVAYPNEEWNAWRNAKAKEISPEDHFVCVQSVVADGRGNLWVLDPAAPNAEKTVKNGPKLVKIELATNKVVRTYAFDEKVAPPASYLNDVRFSNDGNVAYMTDSGRAGLVVLDLATGKAKRVLDNDETTRFEKNVTVLQDGKPLLRPDGRGPQFNADGIALSTDSEALYWQALTGHTLYRVPTSIIGPKGVAPERVKKTVEKVGENGVADGLLITKNGDMIVTSPEDRSLKIRKGTTGELQPLVRNQDWSWPDTLSEGPDGAIYMTDSHIPDSPWFKPGAPAAVPTELWRVVRNK